MAKRFTDSEKWSDPWFSDLPSKYKLFYLYLLDTCDHAGIWKVNFKIASFMIGEPLEHSEVKRILQGRVRFIDDQYWFIEKFIKFQYNGIRADKVGISVTKVLEQNDLHDVIDSYSIGEKQGASKGLARGLVAPKDKDKDKDKAKDKVKAQSKDKSNATFSENLVTIETRDRETLSVDDFQVLHQKLSKIARQRGAMSGISEAKVEFYITKRAKNNWQYKQGGGMVKINENNIGFDMMDMNRNGYLSPASQADEEATYNGGVMN